METLMLAAPLEKSAPPFPFVGSQEVLHTKFWRAIAERLDAQQTEMYNIHI